MRITVFLIVRSLAASETKSVCRRFHPFCCNRKDGVQRNIDSQPKRSMDIGKVLLFDKARSIASERALRTIGESTVKLSAIVAARERELARVHASSYLNRSPTGSSVDCGVFAYRNTTATPTCTYDPSDAVEYAAPVINP